VKALLFPQPWTPHALKNLGLGLAAGLDAEPVSSLARIPFAIARALRPGDYLVPAGGSGPIGSQSYYRAAGELAGQIDEGVLPVPDVIVVALGSGGTAAGLLAGLVANGLRTVVCGVDVSIGNRTSQLLVAGLARWLAARSNLVNVGDSLTRQLTVDTRYLGRGYGWESPAGRSALETAARLGLSLDVTYTAKAFAKALELGGFPGYDPSSWPRRLARKPDPQLQRVLRASDQPTRVLYWHTLSRINPTGLQDFEIPPRLMKQFMRP
jgi:D-cysteine desulfhydrase